MASTANKGFMSNAGFVVTGDGVVVFDALGTPALGRAMIAAIGQGHEGADPPRDRVALSRRPHLRAAGVRRTAPRSGRTARRSSTSRRTSPTERLAQRRAELSPWVDENTHLVPPDLWLDGDTDFRMGGLTFRIIYTGRRALAGGHADVRRRRIACSSPATSSSRAACRSSATADSRGWLAGDGQDDRAERRGRDPRARPARRPTSRATSH